MPPPLHCLDTGDGPGVILLHAFPMTHAMWEPQARRLRRRRRVVAPDIYGFGLTPLPADDWHFPGLAGDVLELADALGLETFTLVGLSMGGYAAFEMLEAAPDRVDALVLADTRARADTDAERRTRMELAAEVERSGAAVLEERLLPRLLGRRPGPDNVHRARRAIRQAAPAAVARALRAMAGRRDCTPRLAGIRAPTLVLGGAEDAITPPPETRAWAARIPAGRFVEIPGAGHLANMENPGAFNEALDAFLAETG